VKVVTEVRLALFDSGEVSAYTQFVEFLEKKRAEETAIQQSIGQQGVQTALCGQATGPATVTATPTPIAPPAKVEVPVAAEPAKEVDEVGVVTALRAYVGRKGVESAVAILAEFGAKRAGDIKADQRAAFVARLAA
jgi:hypothetical protein